MAKSNANTTVSGVPEKPHDDDFKKPVSWLLGPQLIASLKWTALYVGFKGKIDPRDWMQADVCTFKIDERINKNCSEEEFWFDYLADTGDGQKATYSIAYLCLSDLWVGEPVLPKSPVKFEKDQISEKATLLPRGEFLFIGGDTSYHMADFTTLAERFQAPFCWAAADLGITANDHRRPMLGLPANHDYYDVIDGFNRQLRRPMSEEGEMNRLGLSPQLSVPGFKRVQKASYSAIQLPFDWWLLGLDNEVGRLDIRQQEFFRRTYDEMCGGKPPDKLIVATPQPTTVMGRLTEVEGKLAQAFRDLGLKRSFLRDGLLEEGKCRLDLSGDTHHYERYWGPASTEQTDDDREGVRMPGTRSATNYASVVSGLGGAFFHPSHVNIAQVKQRVVYPSPKESRRVVAGRLFDPVILIGGGYVALLGSFMALLIYFAATVPASSRVVVDGLLNQFFKIPPFPETGFARWFPALIWPPKNFAQSAGLTGWGVGWRVGLLAVSVVLIIATVVCAKLLIGLTRKEKEELSGTYSTAAKVSLAGALVFLVSGAKDFWIHASSLSPFKCSIMVLLSVLWAGASLAAGVVYSEWLTKQARKRAVKKIHFWLVWALVAISVVIFVAGTLKFGRYPFAYLFSDVLFIFLVSGVFLGLILLGVVVGGEMHGVGGKIGFGALGLWHAVLQLAVPFLLVRIGSFWAWIAAPVVALAFGLVGKHIARRGRRWLLVGAWLVHGALLLWLPFALRDPSPSSDDGVHALRLVVAAVLGGLMSCIWLGWYLAVSLEFNGHYSEAGGAARIEEYKQFMRIRLTKDSLRAYVIGVDQPRSQGADLKLRIVDMFELKPS